MEKFTEDIENQRKVDPLSKVGVEDAKAEDYIKEDEADPKNEFTDD